MTGPAIEVFSGEWTPPFDGHVGALTRPACVLNVARTLASPRPSHTFVSPAAAPATSRWPCHRRRRLDTTMLEPAIRANPDRLRQAIRLRGIDPLKADVDRWLT